MSHNSLRWVPPFFSGVMLVNLFFIPKAEVPIATGSGFASVLMLIKCGKGNVGGGETKLNIDKHSILITFY